MNAIAAVITKHRDPKQWFSIAVHSDGNILGHGKGGDVQTAERNASLLVAGAYDLVTVPPDPPDPDAVPPDSVCVPEDGIRNSRARWWVFATDLASKGSEREPKWSGDIAPSLEALCRRLSKEAEQMFDRHGELPGMLFLVEAPGRGQAKICLSVDSREQKDAALKGLRRDFARWGVTRYAVTSEAWAGSKNGGERGLRPSEDPERSEAVIVAATNGRENISGVRDIHRPQHGKPSLGKLDLDPMSQGEGQLFDLLRPRSSSDLPDDEGTVFVTRVPDSPIQAMGRRDPTTGELCVGSVYKPGALKPGVHLDEVYDEATRRAIEVVTGPEAEDLIRRVRLTDRTTNLQ